MAPPVVAVGGALLLLTDAFRAEPETELDTVAEVRTVRACDHYIEIETRSGRRFVRGRMGEIVGKLSGGMQVHRSWWVAYDDVAHIERRGRDHEAILSDGRRVAVARSRLSAVRRHVDGKVNRR